MYSRAYRRSRSPSHCSDSSCEENYPQKFRSRSSSRSNSKGRSGPQYYQNNSRVPQYHKNNYSTNKIYYEEAEAVKNRTDKEVQEYLNLHKIRIIKGQPPKPVTQFNEIAFPAFIHKQIQIAGFVAPTPVQSQSWPILMQGQSLIGIAKTGSGKTLAYMLPGIIHLLSQPQPKKGDGPILLVLGPTRELVLQIYEESKKFTVGSNVRMACLYGGVDKFKQRKELQYGVQIIAACPGRLLDFLEDGEITLDRVSYLVLDEADRMLDMGFEIQIRRIVGYLNKERQTVMCSATWPREVRNLAREIFSSDVIHIQIGDADLNANEQITQEIIVMEEFEKMRTLIKCLEDFKYPYSAIVFVKTKKGCDRLSYELRGKGFDSMAIHGDKSQNEREFVLDTFKKKKVNILVATDLAARGLDIKNVTYVINYDFPMQIEDYVHRIGRTGRAGETGVSISFFSPENFGLAKDLIKVLKDANQKVPESLLYLSPNNYHTKKNDSYNRNYESLPKKQSYGNDFKNGINSNQNYVSDNRNKDIKSSTSGNGFSIPGRGDWKGLASNLPQSSQENIGYNNSPQNNYLEKKDDSKLKASNNNNSFKTGAQQYTTTTQSNNTSESQGGVRRFFNSKKTDNVGLLKSAEESSQGFH